MMVLHRVVVSDKCLGSDYLVSLPLLLVVGGSK